MNSLSVMAERWEEGAEEVCKIDISPYDKL